MSYCSSVLLSSLMGVAAAFIGNVIPFAPALAAEKTIDGYMFHQQSRAEGAMNVSINRHHLRIHVPKSGLTLLASAPWKDVFLYCTKTGNVCRISGSVFRNPYLSTREIFDGGTLEGIHVIAGGNAKKLDIDCKKYVEPPGFAKSQMQKKRNATIANRSPYSLAYLVTDQLKTDPELGRLMSRFYAIPTVDDVPIQFDYVDLNGNRRVELGTETWKKANFKATEFQLPAGLKAVKEPMGVLVSDNGAGELDLMMMKPSR